MMDSRTLIKDLLILTGRSASSLASETGLSRSNVTHWLKHGGSSVGVERQDELLEKLGVSGGSLSSKLVHNWILKSGDLSSVERILKWAGKKPYEMIYLVPDPVDWRYRGSDLVKFPLLIRSPDSISPIRIVLRRKPSILIPDSEIQEEDIILVGTGLVKWSQYREISSVKQDLYEKFIRKDISSQEYDQVWNSVSGEKMNGAISTKGESEKTPQTLEELVNQAKSKGISLQEASEKLFGKSGE